MLQIIFQNKRYEGVAPSTTPLSFIKRYHPALQKGLLAAVINEQVVGLTLPLEQSGTLTLLHWTDIEGKKVFWHSTAHVLAEAILHFYPKALLSTGPPTKKGFYFDIDFGEQPFDSQHIPAIEERMLKMAGRQDPFVRRTVTRAEATAYYTTHYPNPYKRFILANLPQEVPITFYDQGAFTDLCKGPHLPTTGPIKAVKITNVAGAYWRGDTTQKQLTRIYGISFPKRKLLTEHLARLEEAKKRDHRQLGQRLQLFTFSKKVGVGLPLWLPKGTLLRQLLMALLNKEQEGQGYQPVTTPHIAHKALYITSGHYEKYGKDSFQPITTPHAGEAYFLKPMNCPHHCEIYAQQPRSYRELPLRFSEYGTVYRYEQHGELNGLTRTRCFTQDDAHIFCTPDQVQDEVKCIIELVKKIFQQLGLHQYKAQIAVRDLQHPKKYIGTEALWAEAEAALTMAAKEANLAATVVPGEAAFYGPKIDFMVEDALERSWQLGTIQLDYQLPERFQLEYSGVDNKKQRPVMIHRAPFGSLERFIALLLEHTNGNLPLLLAPVQVVILPVTEKVHDYAKEVEQRLDKAGFRTAVDWRKEKIGKKIREQELQKVPYMVILGVKEQEGALVTYRTHGANSKGSLPVEQFIQHLTTLLSAEEEGSSSPKAP